MNVPYGLREFFEGMGDEDRLAVVILLLSTGPRSPSAIGNALGLSDSRVERSLEVLSDIAIIRRVNNKWNEDKKVFDSDYEVYPVYQRILRDIIKTLEVRP